MTEIRRRLYKRGSSYESTLPVPILFSLDMNKRYNAVFRFEDGRWYIDFEEMKPKFEALKNEIEGMHSDNEKIMEITKKRKI